MIPLQVTEPCTPNLLLGSVCWPVSWQTQTGKTCARSLQMFVNSWWFFFRMYHLPVTEVWSMPSWRRDNVQHRKILLFCFYSLLSILILIILCHWKPGTRRGIFIAMSVFAYISFIFINNFPEFLGSFSVIFIRPQKHSLQFYTLQFTAVPRRNIVQLVQYITS